MGKWMLMACLLSGCHDPTEIEYRTKIPDKNREAARAWVAQCILDANPQSDEEPEDWIRQCEITATGLLALQQLPDDMPDTQEPKKAQRELALDNRPGIL